MPNERRAQQRLPYLTLAVFAAAMAYLEAAVVVYLRELFHPNGFLFPLQPIAPRFALTELGREVATLVMIWGAAWLSGGNARERFASFAYLFGVWDILFYAWLKVLIGWPQGLLDPDILFLIPTPWVGPVLAPMLVSALLIVLAFVLRPYSTDGTGGNPPKAGFPEWGLFLGGAALVLWTFLEPNLATAGLDKPVVYPEHYNGWAFAAGMALGAIGTARLALQRSGHP